MHPIFASLHADVRAWCHERLGSPTPPQAGAVPHLLAGKSTLVCSPTGTGKTLAAFLPAFSRLATLRDEDRLFARPFILYISPLRALGYDVEVNVRRPLREMGLLERPNTERASLRRGRVREGYVRTGVRTGDTPTEERRLMIARPPHILMTTPESLALMLAMESYRKHFRDVETVIVDEVHALAGNKRGAHLALCLESLEDIVRTPLVRVGLSATVEPLDRVAAFLAGADRPCEIVDNRGLRSIKLTIDVPFAGAIASMPKVAEAAVRLGRDVRTQLVFTNVRSQAERLAHEIAKLEDPERVALPNDDAIPRPRTDAKIGIHHSALERSMRHRVEAQLRSGDLHTVVCSSSLELGIDIGFVDRVCIVGGARGVAATLQRVGRAGHRPGATADGVIVAQDRDDIIEAAAVRRCIANGTIEELKVPDAPLDVLAQWLVQSVCYDRRFPIADALAVARRAYPFRSLAEHDLRACVRYLSGEGAGADEAHVRRIGSDGEAVYGLGREVCAAFFDNVGTIPDETGVFVRAKGGGAIGKLDESFVNTLKVGDVFLLGGKAYKVREMGTTGLTVEPARERPNVPMWSSHIKGVPVLLAREVAHLRRGVAERLDEGGPRVALAWLDERYGLGGEAAAHVLRYIAQQMALSYVPRVGEATIEIYRIDRRQTAVFHTCAGRRANEAIARVVGARLMRDYKIDTQLTTDDNGFLVSLPAGKRFPDAVWSALLGAAQFDRDLLSGLRSSQMLRRHFRYVANTGLLVLRRAAGRSLRRASAWNSGMIFDRLYEADRDFPLVRETIRVVRDDLLDAAGARAYLEAMPSEPRVLHPAVASPFTFGIITSSFGDTVIIDDRASMVEALHERVLSAIGDADTGPREAGTLFERSAS